ncbi:hypothetical protein Dimus_009538 [Dionaea muscipula]
MASLQASSLLLFSSSSSSSTSSTTRTICSTLHIPNLQKYSAVPQLQQNNPPKLLDELNARRDLGFVNTATATATAPAPLDHIGLINSFRPSTQQNSEKVKLYAILEAIGDRIEMHKNIGEQRQNWSVLLLNSINMMTLTATVISGISTAATNVMGTPTSVLAFKLPSTLLFTAATGMLVIMNKIQPSQLVEEQRNAVRLFTQLQRRLQTNLALEKIPTDEDVKDAMENVLALDKAYPLPLLGVMIEKFPKSFEPAAWWPPSRHHNHEQQQQQERDEEKEDDIKIRTRMMKNGWSRELEEECRDIVGVMKRKDEADYARLGNKALHLSKMLAISGPLLTGIAAVGSAFIGSPTHGPWAAALVAAVAGSLASIVNTLEHGGQVGMVLEMYRNSAGFFKNLEETVDSTLEEGEMEKRENGELFEMKMALSLGRSLSQLRELAATSRCCDRGGSSNEDFASKLF